MAYDWSGNNIKQKRYDWLVIAALVALAVFVTATPLALMRGGAATDMVETASLKM